MKKFIFPALFIAWNTFGQLTVGVVPYDGVVVVAGAAPVIPPVVYNEPVIYNAPVHYDGPVIYKAPVVYNDGGLVNVNSSGYPTSNYTPCEYPRYDSGCSPSVIYFGGSQANYRNYDCGYQSYSPDVVYVHASDPFHRSYR